MAGTRWTRRGAASSRSVLAAVALVGGVALAGCAAGQQAQTAEQRPTVNGANVKLGALSLLDVALEYPADGVYEKGSDARLRMTVVNDATSSDALVEVRTDLAERVTVTAAGAAGAAPTPTLTAPPPSETGEPTGSPTATAENPSPSITADPADPSATGSPSGSASPGTPTPSPAPSPTPTAAAPVRIPLPSNGLVSFREDGPTILLVGLTERLLPAQRLTVTLVFANAGEIEVPIAVSVPEEQISTAPTVEGHEEE